MQVHTLTFHGDGEMYTRAFRTEEARDEALLDEALERYEIAIELGTDTYEWTEKRVREEPVEFIAHDSYDEVDVHTDVIELEN